MAQSIEGRSRELLEQPNFCHVGSLREDGSPHVVPVWVDTDGSYALLNTAEGRVWANNAERDPRLALTVAHRENPYEYVTIRGRVEEITREGADEHIDKLAKKYLGLDEYPLRQPGEQRVILRVSAERVHHMDPGS